MRDILSDIVTHASSLFTVVTIKGTPTETRVSAYTEDQSLFFEGTLTTPVAEFEGEFGLPQLQHLKGLLDFPSYRTDEATFEVTRTARKSGVETVTEFKFRDADKAGSNFKTMLNPPEQVTTDRFDWKVNINPTRAKIDEFAKLASLYGTVKYVGVSMQDEDLIFSLGDEGTTTNNATMMFAKNVGPTLKKTLLINIFHFLTVMKLAGTKTTTLSLANYSVMGIEIVTKFAKYNYYLRHNSPD